MSPRVKRALIALALVAFALSNAGEPYGPA